MLFGKELVAKSATQNAGMEAKGFNFGKAGETAYFQITKYDSIARERRVLEESTNAIGGYLKEIQLETTKNGFKMVRFTFTDEGEELTFSSSLGYVTANILSKLVKLSMIDKKIVFSAYSSWLKVQYDGKTLKEVAYDWNNYMKPLQEKGQLEGLAKELILNINSNIHVPEQKTKTEDGFF